MGWSMYQRRREDRSCLGIEFITGLGIRMGGCGVGFQVGNEEGGVRLTNVRTNESGARETRGLYALGELKLCAIAE